MREFDSNRRLSFIDALRGIAALMVAVYHFTVLYKAPPTEPHGMPTIRDVYEFLAWHGNLGVDIFFVISGFVIAYSLRNTPVTPRSVGNFAFRRSLRLDPPYWGAMLLAVGCGWLSRLVLKDSNAYLPSGIWEVVTNVTYLQDILEFGSIIPVAWTLCLEVQFYLAFILLWGPARTLGRKLASEPGNPSQWLLLPFVPVAVLSLLVRFQAVELPIPGLFIEFWFLFQLGVLVFLALSGRIYDIWFALYAVATGCCLWFRWDLQTVAGLIAAVTIFAVGKANHLHDWLTNRPLQYLGRISYSLYLIHTIVGSRVMNILWRLTDRTPAFWMTVIFVVLALAASIVAAHLLHRFIEKPAMEFAHRMRRRPAPQVAPAVERREAA